MRVAIYDPALHMLGGGEKYAVALAEALQLEHDVHLFGRTTVERAALEAFFGVDLSKTQVHLLPTPTIAMKVALRLHLPKVVYWALRDHQYFWWFRRQAFDQFHTVCFDGMMPNPSAEGVYSIMFPSRLHGWAAKVNPVTKLLARRGWPVGLAALETHQKWVTISEFTQGWTRRYWGDHPTEVLYPPCDSPHEDVVAKRKMILNVGRFFGMSSDNRHHHKRQDVLIKAFAAMTDLHERGWELHLAGAVNGGSTNPFLEQVRREAEGLPIYIHPDAPLDEIRRLFDEASIYWHATGYGTDPDELPSAQEHFGIAPVEAMSTGAVPLVYGTAGPAETVVDRVSGRLWWTVEELRTYTRELASEPEQWRSLSEGALSRASVFGREAFNARARAISARGNAHVDTRDHR